MKSTLSLLTAALSSTNVFAVPEVTDSLDATASINTISYNQLKFWVLILFVVLALLFSMQIVTDNQPDPARDSILYSKFLTKKVESNKND